MRSPVLTLSFILAAGAFAPAGIDSVPALADCAAAAIEAAPDDWDPATAMTGDLTMDGTPDVVFWKREGESVLVYIVSCDAEKPVESWRFGVSQSEDCPPDEALVQVGSLLLDPVLVERVCAGGEQDECEHLRMENVRRQALMDAGARELRVRGPGCAPVHFRWSKEHAGFMRITGG